MDIGIVVAFLNELLLDLNGVQIKKVCNISQMDVYSFTFKGVESLVICSGVGKVNAAIATQVLISKYNVDYVVNIGYAATSELRGKKGDIFVSKKCIQYDFDASAYGYYEGQIPNFTTPYIEQDFEMSINNLPIKKGVVLTGDRFFTNSTEICELFRKFGGDCIDMEGAAVAQCAVLNNKRYLLVKYISDFADELSVNENNEVYTVHSIIEHIIIAIDTYLKLQ